MCFFQLVLLLVACFRLSISRRWVGSNEPTMTKQAGTLFVVGEDKNVMVQTWLENLGLWEAMDWKKIYHIFGDKYTTTTLTKTNLEAAVFHLRNFGKVGKLTEDACFYHPFFEALEEGHWVVLIPIVVPSCSPDKNLSRRIAEIEKHKLIYAYHTREAEDFMKTGNLTENVTSVNLSKIFPVPETTEGWIEFSGQRSILNKALKGNEIGIPGGTGWPILFPVCYVEARSRSNCLPGMSDVCSELLSRTEFWVNGDVNCTSLNVDCRNCPDSFPDQINEETTSQTWTPTTLAHKSPLAFTLTSTSSIVADAINLTTTTIQNTSTRALEFDKASTKPTEKKSLEAEESDLPVIIIASLFGFVCVIMCIGIAILTEKVLERKRRGEFGSTLTTFTTTTDTSALTTDRTRSSDDIDNTPDEFREPIVPSQEAEPRQHEPMSPTQEKGAKVSKQSYEPFSMPPSTGSVFYSAFLDPTTNLKTGTPTTPYTKTATTKGTTQKTTGTTKTGGTTNESSQLPTPHPGSIVDSTSL